MYIIMYMHVHDLSEGLESDDEPKSKVYKTWNPGMTKRLTADKDPKPTPAKVKEDSTEKFQTTSITVLNENNTGQLQQGSLGMYIVGVHTIVKI